MKKLVEVQLDEESTILVEVEDIGVHHGPEAYAANPIEQVEKASENFFDKPFDSIMKYAKLAKDKMKIHGPDSPDEFEISFSGKFTSQAGVILTNFGAEANISVKIKWKKSEK